MIRGASRSGKGITLLALALLLAACNTREGAAPTTGTIGTPVGGGGSTPVSRSCSLASRESWLLAQMREWYLFPETLPAALSPAPFATADDYLDALTATARAQHRDRYFTYLTSIAGENAYYQSGQTAGLGVRLDVEPDTRRVFVSEGFEGSPALAAGIDRGTEILAIGTSAASLQSVAAIMASAGEAGLLDALGPSTAGTTRALRVRDAVGERIVTVTKAVYAIAPVSPRYGARVIVDQGRKVGYINLRTFISSASPALRTAFGDFKAQGIDEVIVDLRYNGGGLVSVAQVFASLLGGGRHASDVVASLTFRPDKSAENEHAYFLPEANAIAPRRIAFIATRATASASELVVNALRPYLHGDVALVGDNSYGKPVGQIALDLAECDDRLRLIAFSVDNAAGEGDYFDGLAPIMESTCRAEDEVAAPLGDPAEDSVARALDFLDGRPCTPIGGGVTLAAARSARAAPAVAEAQATPARHPLMPEQPSAPQREVPGLF